MTRTEWSIHVDNWERSGESCGAFAAKHNLCPRKLGWWRWKLTEESNTLIEVTVDANPPPLTLHIGEHVISFDVGQLSGVLDVLETR